MRHLPALAAAVVIFAATLAAHAGADDEPNLVANGGAEQGPNDRPAGWERAFVPSPTLKFGRDLEHAKVGKACFFVENHSPYAQPVANNWRQDLKSIPPAGTPLRLTAFIKTADAVDGVNVCLQFWDAGSKNMVGFASTEMIKGDNDWTAMKSDRVIVPRGTKTVTVRASLGGTGKVWFDEIAVRKEPRETTTRGATTQAASGDTIEDELRQRVDGKVVGVLPVEQDQMVLAYLPEWAHGRVDNIAVANNDGGVRTLLAWAPVGNNTADRKFLLALYARESVSKGEAGAIGAYEVLDEWDEQTPWVKQPKTAEQPLAEYPFDNAKGWRVFDVTKLVAAQSRGPQPPRGVMLRFLAEDKTAETWSGYAFVSREGAGEWETRHPLLLVVQ